MPSSDLLAFTTRSGATLREHARHWLFDILHTSLALPAASLAMRENENALLMSSTPEKIMTPP